VILLLEIDLSPFVLPFVREIRFAQSPSPFGIEFMLNTDTAMVAHTSRRASLFANQSSRRISKRRVQRFAWATWQGGPGSIGSTGSTRLRQTLRSQTLYRTGASRLVLEQIFARHVQPPLTTTVYTHRR